MENTIQDERGGWTSASNAEADSLCPGRHIAQRGLPEGAKGADAESGTRIHAWLELPLDKGPELSDAELETAEKCNEIECNLISHVFDCPLEDKARKVLREHRMWLTFGDYKHSGKADVIHLYRDAAMVIDYKTGRNEATESPRNLQLRDLAVLAASNLGVKTVHVSIVQPWATMKPEICTYTVEDLMLACDEMRARVEDSNNPKSSRVPGATQCQYCRAKKTCPEFLRASLPHPAIKPDPDAYHPEAIKSGIMAMEGSRLGLFLGLVRLANETAEDEVRQRIARGESVEGWALKPGRETEKINDPQAVFNRALAAGIPQNKFVSDCITVGKTALKTALKTATELKGKALDAKLDELLDGATETKTSGAILTKV